MPSTMAENARATRAGRSSPPGSLGVVAAFAAWAVGIGFAVPGRADQPAVVEGGRKEAKLVIYTGVERAAAQIVINAVRKKYPFIAAETGRAPASTLATRPRAETETNRVRGDGIE